MSVAGTIRAATAPTLGAGTVDGTVTTWLGRWLIGYLADGRAAAPARSN